MGLFKKRGSDVLDLTHLQERGLLKRAVVEKPESDVLDLSQPNMGNNSAGAAYPDLGMLAGASQNESIEQETSSPPNFDFLGNLAQSSTDSSNVVSRSIEAVETNEEQIKKVEHLKVKIEDLEYKLDRFLERLESMEDKIDKT